MTDGSLPVAFSLLMNYCCCSAAAGSMTSYRSLPVACLRAVTDVSLTNTLSPVEDNFCSRQ